MSAVPSLHTGHLSDALDILGITGGRSSGMVLIAPPGVTAIGRAFTLKQVAVTADNLDFPPATRHAEAARELAEPGDILVIDVGGDLSTATWGEAHTLRAMARGVAGVLINGATRDATGIRARGLPVVCRGFSPARSAGRLHTESIGEVIEFCGLRIAPGDLLAFDEDGVVCVPRAQAELVMAKANEIAAREELRDRELETHLR